jgi:phosphoribosylaminoimidazole-succinocarboxamide synthase
VSETRKTVSDPVSLLAYRAFDEGELNRLEIAEQAALNALENARCAFETAQERHRDAKGKSLNAMSMFTDNMLRAHGVTPPYEHEKFCYMSGDRLVLIHRPKPVAL